MALSGDFSHEKLDTGLTQILDLNRWKQFEGFLMAPTWDAIFTNLNSGLVLDITDGGVRQSGAPVQQYGFHGQFNQQFQLFPIDGRPSTYFIGTVAQEPFNRAKFQNPAFCLDVAGASINDGAAIQVFRLHGGFNQQFAIKLVSQDQPDFFRIIAVHSGKCLDVEFRSLNQGAKVHQFRNNGQSNQIWRWVKPQDIG